MVTTLQFLGATEFVTESRFVLEAGKHRMLIDCGLFHGTKELRLRNWAHFPIDPGQSITLFSLTPPEPRNSLAEKIQQQFGWIVLPDYLEKVDL